MAQELILISKPKYEKLTQELKMMQSVKNQQKMDNDDDNEVDTISKIDKPNFNNQQGDGDLLTEKLPVNETKIIKNRNNPKLFVKTSLFDIIKGKRQNEKNKEKGKQHRVIRNKK